MSSSIAVITQKYRPPQRGKGDRLAKRPAWPKRPLELPLTDFVETAKAAGLRYVTDSVPGITRQPAGKGFRYIDVEGKTLRDPKERRRIKALAIPPAWTNVWICPLAHGHLQATGRDAKGRKQYRYHARWRAVRDETKYDRMAAFGQVLPRVRQEVDRALALPGLAREKILATVVRLLETTFIRVGNEEYARQNHSFGLTTMRTYHVNVSGSTLRFEFRGKSGIKHVIDVNDRRLARIIKRCQDLPGYELFQYIDEKGDRQTIESADVNEYLRKITGQDFTAKDFRTWAGTVLTVQTLKEIGGFDSQAQAKRNTVQAIEWVAQRMGNTRTVCRNCYVHPRVIEAYLDGSLLSIFDESKSKQSTTVLDGLDWDETALLRLLEKNLKRASAP